MTEQTAVYDVDRALALLDEAQRCAAWMERVSSELESMMTNDPKLINKIETYVLSKRINDTLEEARKLVGAVVQKGSYSVLPEKMSEEGMKTVNTDSGYRVTASERLSVSMIDKERGFEWLRDNDLGDIIVEQVNAQTLSAQARRLIEEENMDLPEEIFKVSIAQNISLTKIKK